MLTFPHSAKLPASHTVGALAPLRSVRPSLLDLRFNGDPWIVGHANDMAWLQLDNYPLALIPTTPFDLPTLNQLLLQLRQWQLRRRYYQRLRAQRATSICTDRAGVDSSLEK